MLFRSVSTFNGEILQADQIKGNPFQTFVGGNVRKVTQSGYADYIPVFLSETQKLYRAGVVPCNVAMIQVSTPDKHGYVSLGTSVDATLAAVETAEHVIAVVNKHVPRSFGDAMIHTSQIDMFVQDDTPLEEAHFTEPNETETAIGKHCAALIEDGATLQMGIGAIPNAVLAQLGGHRNLGIHTEMFADGVLPLVESGVINGRDKAIDKGKMVSTFLMGSQKVYDFIDNNPGIWDETRDYFYPIPTDDRSLTGGALTQNPGWNDGLNF